jgi:hypothetical protein
MLWMTVEKLFNLLNTFANRRGLLLNYSVIDISTTDKDQGKQNRFHDSTILIQGPILFPKLLDNAITFYRVTYPEVPIILSTWKNEDNLRKLKKISEIHLIENSPPSIAGISNINFQVTSTLSGLEFASQNSAKYILKIRSDQGLFASNFLDQFHLALGTSPRSAFKRIVTTDFNSFLFRPNSPNDQIQFAETETLMNFWSSYDIKKVVSGSFPEEILLLGYLAKLGISQTRSLRSSLEIYRDHFVFLDATALGFAWRKGSWRHPDSRFDQLNRSSLLKFVTPDEWRRLCIDIEPILKEATELGLHSGEKEKL